MISIHPNYIFSDKVLLSRDEFDLLVEKARELESIEIKETMYDFTVDEIMDLEVKSGAYDFLLDKREDVYTVNDVKIRYK